MAVTTTPQRVEKAPRIADESGGAKKSKPVKFWATIGALWLALQVVVYTSWITSDRLTTTPTGPDEAPEYMKAVIRGWEILSIPALLVFLYFVLFRPWKRQRRVTLDGLFCLVFVTIVFHDPLSEWIAPHFTYNANLINHGSWLSDVPGWVLPNAHQLPEPLLFIAPLYIYVVFGMTMVGCAVMRKAKERWPNISNAGLIGVCSVFFIIFDGLFEPLLMIIGGFWAYPGAVDWLTVFRGEYYQFPIYEPFLFGGVLWTGWTCVRYFKNDKGQTIAERGIDEVRASPRQKTVLRFLALVGITNSLYFAGYNFPIQIFAAHGGPWPEEIQNRSYLRDGFCGEGTTYKCWGPSVPIPRPDSSHVSPDGKLIPASTD